LSLPVNATSAEGEGEGASVCEGTGRRTPGRDRGESFGRWDGSDQDGGRRKAVQIPRSGADEEARHARDVMERDGRKQKSGRRDERRRAAGWWFARVIYGKGALERAYFQGRKAVGATAQKWPVTISSRVTDRNNRETDGRRERGAAASGGKKRKKGRERGGRRREREHKRGGRR